jgi:hypothetical protein
VELNTQLLYNANRWHEWDLSDLKKSVEWNSDVDVPNSRREKRSAIEYFGIESFGLERFGDWKDAMAKKWRKLCLE